MYAIINENKLYLVQINFNDYSFTTRIDLATKFITKEGAESKIRKLPMFKNLKAVKCWT